MICPKCGLLAVQSMAKYVCFGCGWKSKKQKAVSMTRDEQCKYCKADLDRPQAQTMDRVFLCGTVYGVVSLAWTQSEECKDKAGETCKFCDSKPAPNVRSDTAIHFLCCTYMVRHQEQWVRSDKCKEQMVESPQPEAYCVDPGLIVANVPTGPCLMKQGHAGDHSNNTATWSDPIDPPQIDSTPEACGIQCFDEGATTIFCTLAKDHPDGHKSGIWSWGDPHKCKYCKAPMSNHEDGFTTFSCGSVWVKTGWVQAVECKHRVGGIKTMEEHCLSNATPDEMVDELKRRDLAFVFVVGAGPDKCTVSWNKKFQALGMALVAERAIMANLKEIP